jgi:hypothetical protein
LVLSTWSIQGFPYITIRSVRKIIYSKRAVEWRGKLLSHAAGLELVRSTLASIPLYLLNVIKFPKWAIKLINSHMAHCLWGTIWRSF